MGSFFLRDTQDKRPLPEGAGPDATRARAAVYSSPRPITASAERINLAQATVQNRTYTAWQDEAWTAYERVGEVHFGYNLLANLLSRIRFFGASLGKANEPPSDVALDNDDGRVSGKLAKAVAEVVDELFAYDMPGMLRSFALNLSIPGECYLIKLPATGTRPERWAIRSVKEVSVRAGSAVLTPSRTSGQEQMTLPTGTFIARIWRRHPEYSDEPDSGLLGVREEVEELLMLQRLIRSAIRSRMNAGLLFVPEGITSGMSGTQTAEPPIEEPDDALTALASSSVNDPSGQFMADLMESMTAPISNESVASAYVPMLAVGPGDLGQQIRHVTFERSTDAWLADRIEKTLARVLQGIDMPQEIVTGVGAVKYCMDSNTQALTRDGWKNYRDLTIGEPILTFNPHTHLNEWQPIQAVNTFDCVDEPMLSLEQRGHSSLSTLDHRWMVRRATSRDGRRTYDQQTVTSRELSTGHFIPIAAPAAELPSEPKYTDAFVELIAWYWTEGYVSRNASVFDVCVDRAGFRDAVDTARRATGLTWVNLGHATGTYSSDNSANVSIHHLVRRGGLFAQQRERVAAALGIDPDLLHKFFQSRVARQHIVITQSAKVNSPYVQRIRACLTGLVGPAMPHPRGGGPAAWREFTTDSGITQFLLNDELVREIQAVCPGDDKVTDLAFVHSLTRAQLELFIETSIAADGWYRSSGEGVIHQKVEARLDALELACILSGRGVHRYRYDAANGCTQHTLAIKKRTWVQPIRTNSPRVETPYTGVVWCPTVANHMWYAKRNGTVFCTANSNAVVINEGIYTAHIEPLALVVADAFTSVHLRPALRARGFSPEEIAQVVIWYDPAEIVTRPNSADEATQGLDRGTLSPAAWRREHGYAEADAPSEQERAQILLNKALTVPDVVLIPLFKQAFPELLKDVEDPKPAADVPPQLQAAQSQKDGAVVQFPSQVKQAQPAADPQRTAIKQVGVN